MTQIKDCNTPQKQRISKADWLAAGLEFLRKGGIEAVRVERLAASLNVAKSGFYYHFRDRAHLNEELLEHWVSVDHQPATADRDLKDASIEERLSKIAEVVDRADLGSYDFAIRQWARQDPKVRRIWRKEMKKRIGIIREMLSQLGFEGDELEMRTRLFVSYHLTERELFDDLRRDDRARLRRLRMAFLLGAENKNTNGEEFL